MKKGRLVFWFVTGMSGAGKTQTINCFEDLGFFCVDNLPVALLPKMAELCAQPDRPIKRVALGIDVREGEFLKDFTSTIALLKKQGVDSRIIFLDADDKTLFRRFSETRRRHPLGGSVRNGIARERKRLLKIKEMADKIIDTSTFNQSELKQTILHAIDKRITGPIHITVMSFGYKYGLPVDVDIVWDVRFMPNPNYEPALRNKTGLDAAVRRFVLRTPQARKFSQKFFSLLTQSMPHYIQEGKSYLGVAIGCTGGRHRSVVMAEALRKHLAKKGFKVRMHHRDVER